MLIAMALFFAACRNVSASHSFAHFRFDHHRGGILIPLSTGAVGNVKLFVLYDVVRLASYDPVLYLLAIWNSQEIGWSPYGGASPAFFAH